MPVLLKELAVDFRGSEKTLRARIRELEREKKFKKKSKGRFYSEVEAQQIAKLLAFKLTILDYKNGNGIGKHEEQPPI